MISKAEMTSYFIRANCHAMRKCFKHNFHETTYFKPTFCIHCTGLVRMRERYTLYSAILSFYGVFPPFQLWGLIKQGWKCKGIKLTNET